jgi:hypothetical protein
MSRILDAVAGLTTVVPFSDLKGVKLPEESLVPAITVGETRTPLFAIVANMLVACIALSE